MLLIVPYGIETKKTKHLSGKSSQLLIVPYGIETEGVSAIQPMALPFNCTLWN